MQRMALVAAMFGLFATGAHAADVKVPEGRVWLEGKPETSKRMGMVPPISVSVNAGKVGPDACEMVAKGTKWGRAVWGMKGKAHTFKLRAAIDHEGKKHTIAGAVSVDASGGQKVVSCELVEYDESRDGKPTMEDFQKERAI